VLLEAWGMAVLNE